MQNCPDIKIYVFSHHGSGHGFGHGFGLDKGLALGQVQGQGGHAISGCQVDDQGQGLGQEMFGRALFGPLAPLTH